MLRCVLSERALYRVVPLTLVCVLAFAGLAAAQGTGGVISGTVKDAQGAVLPGVTLTVRNTESGVARTGVSEDNGSYRFAGLPPGRYELSSELPGFASGLLKDLTLTINLELRRDLTMALQGVQESVTVTGQAPVIETTSTEVASVVTQEQIDSLPISGRQPTSLALLLPGTTMDTTTVRRSQASVGAGGSSNVSNMYYVDGGNNMLYNSGQQFLEVPQSAIREFKVNINQSSAQYGAIGGVLLTATNSGTNRFSGEAFEYFRDKRLNAFDKFQLARHQQFGDPKPDYRRNSYGGAFGGPIIKDRLHFFVAIERSVEPKSAQVNTGQPQFYSSVEGSFPASYERRAYFYRGDFQINSQQSAFIRYAADYEANLCEACGGFSAAFTGSDTHSPRASNLVGHTWVISSRMLNEVRSQLPPSRLRNVSVPPGLPYWPSSKSGQFPPERFTGYTPIYQFPSLTWGANTWSNNVTNRWDISDDLSINTGSHDWKFGGAFLNYDSPEEQASNIATWTFRNDQYFNPKDPASIANLTGATQFTSSFPPLTRHLENHWIQGYIQDDWRVRSNLTLNLGVRYDNQYRAFNNQLDITPVPKLAEIINPSSRGDHNNFGPRAGFAWDMRNDGKSVLRGSYGVAYQYVMAGGMRTEVTALRQTSIVIANPTYPDPYGGKTPASFASTAPPNVNVTDDDIINPRGQSATVGFSRELMANMALHVDGDFANVENTIMTANVNTPDPASTAIVRPRPTWGRIIELQATGRHRYRAMFVRLEKRYSNRYQYLLSYTLAKQRNFGQGTNPQFTDVYNHSLDWGTGSTDRRQVLVSSGSILLKYDINIGAVWTLRSTMPFSARAGADLNRDGVTVNGQHTDFVPGTTRNVFNRGDNTALLAIVNAYRAANGRGAIPESQLDTNGVKRLDVRLSKAVRLGANQKIEFIAQVFNVLGSDTLGGIAQGWQENALSDSFGRITTVLPRQQGELAVRVTF